MKKILILTLFVLYTNSLWAQFARIEDKDGFVNIHSKPNVGSLVLEKAYEADVLWCFEREGEWYPMDLERKGKVVSGYIHNSRVKFIDTLDPVPVKEIQSNKLVFQNENINVEIITKPFVKSAHTIKYSQVNKTEVITKIDNKPIWGTDGNVAKVAYSQINIKVGNKQVVLPQKEIENVYEPNFNFTKVNYDKQSDRLYISSLNSDGAGGYAVLWMIKDGKYINRTTLRPF